MNTIRHTREVNGSSKESQKTSGVSPSTEDRLRIFANLIIDRILEEKARGNLSNLEKKKES